MTIYLRSGVKHAIAELRPLQFNTADASFVMGCPKVLHRTFLAALVGVTAAGLTVGAQEQVQATFRSSLSLVSVAVVVRDGGGKLVTDLSARDFEIVDAGVARPVTHFEAGRDADARLALLVDSSGSMVVGAKPERTRMAADFLIAKMRPADAATVFSFDSEVRRLTAYTGNADILRTAVSRVVPFGSTCLFDAIVGTAETVQDDSPRARAVVLLTDGIDTASLYSADDAATAAARLDLPVYVLGVGSLAGQPTPGFRDAAPTRFSVAELARRTGGTSAEASSPAQLSIVTQTILDELHHQYLLAFEGGTERGWHSLQVRVRKGKVNVRSRDGYFVH
jgi:VWFA-related protein